MATELMAGLGLFKSMFDMAKRLKDINDTAVRNAAIIELQEKILAAQSQQSALIEDKVQLEKRVTELEAWGADKKRYELKEVASGLFAYAVKEKARGSEPSHILCANCYNSNQKSVLQTETRFPGAHKVTFCQCCGSELFSPDTGGRGQEHPPPTYVQFAEKR